MRDFIKNWLIYAQSLLPSPKLALATKYQKLIDPKLLNLYASSVVVLNSVTT